MTEWIYMESASQRLVGMTMYGLSDATSGRGKAVLSGELRGAVSHDYIRYDIALMMSSPEGTIRSHATNRDTEDPLMLIGSKVMWKGRVTFVDERRGVVHYTCEELVYHFFPEDPLGKRRSMQEYLAELRNLDMKVVRND